MTGIHRLPEDIRTDKRLGRHVRHDPRSLAYKVEPRGLVVSAHWNRIVPVLDQGNLGSCTGNATVGLLGTEPFFPILRSIFPAQNWDEQLAIDIYSLATQIDSEPENYPPTDTGSDGLSVAKVATSHGFISGYKHITSLAAAHTAIQTGPFITGTNWLSGMDDTDASGRVHATGTVRGGHEYEVVGYDAVHGLWEFVNSWGPGWGVDGHFFMSDADYASLLAQDGDATQFVPISQPAPKPTAVPFPIEAVQPWLNSRLSTLKGCAARDAIKGWLAAGGR